jgi:hypothetical protein
MDGWLRLKTIAELFLPKIEKVHHAAALERSSIERGIFLKFCDAMFE